MSTCRPTAGRLRPRLHWQATVRAGFLVLAAVIWVPVPVHAGNDGSFEVRLEDGSPGEAHLTLQASQGSTVAIRVHSDRAVTLHLHGYDRDWTVPAGGEATLRFEADFAGRFPVEAHDGHGHGPLFHVEIRPD